MNNPWVAPDGTWWWTWKEKDYGPFATKEAAERDYELFIDSLEVDE